MTNFSSKTIALLTLAIVLHFSTQNSFAQLDKFERNRAKGMLETITRQVKKRYYDPDLRGIDLDAKVKSAKERIDRAKSLGQAFGIIAQVLLDFNDSHTNFIPPGRAAKFEYGWKMMMVGDKSYVYAVKPKSDAHKKGLKTGDMILSVNGFHPTRKDLWKMNYYYYALSPQAQIKLRVRSPNQEPREIVTKTKIRKLSRILNLESSIDVNEILRELNDDNESLDHRFFKTNGITVWKMPTFSFNPSDVKGIINTHIKNQQGLILDLRGNGGGLVKTLEQLVGYVFDKDLKIAQIKLRNKTQEMVAKKNEKYVFKGKLIVLIDSRSGSASEIFARLTQLEKRGIVLGDTSAGAVMMSRYYRYTMGSTTQIAYGASITEADVIMSDGSSVELVGVVPNQTLLPTSDDLANERDPVMAAALQLLGVKTSSEQAGQMFPVFWADGKKGNVTAKKP